MSPCEGLQYVWGLGSGIPNGNRVSARLMSTSAPAEARVLNPRMICCLGLTRLISTKNEI